MTLEQYKTLAEFAGIEVYEGQYDPSRDQRTVWLAPPGRKPPMEYTPDTNDAQAWELLEEADRRGFNIYLENSGNRKYATFKKRTDRTHCVGPTYKGGGNTYRDAICHAVLAIGGEG